MAEITEYEILKTMERYGGGFIQQLVVLYHHADQVNQAKLRAAFANYFEEYREMAMLTKQWKEK